MQIQSFFKDYIDHYKGLDVYKESEGGKQVYQWNYEDGCLLLGCKKMYEVTGDDFYKDYIVRFVDPYVDSDGNISSYVLTDYNLDFVNSGKLFYFLEDVTGDEKYRKATERIMTQLRFHPRLKTGNFWHKLIYPYQVWLDGLYLGQPFYLEYENRYNGRKNYYDIVNQFKICLLYTSQDCRGRYGRSAAVQKRDGGGPRMMSQKVLVPKTLPEFKKILTDYGSQCTLLAGGTDLLVEMRKQQRPVETIVDLSYLDSLRGITQDKDWISIGAMTTFSELAGSRLIYENGKCLWEAAGRIGSCLLYTSRCV